MCCIIHRPKGAKEISLSDLERLIKVNSDGWGTSYFKDGHIKVRKSLNMDEAIAQVRELEKEDVEFLFHVRYATHGLVTLENCHPFNLTDGVMFHNGKINVYCRDKKMSDTYYFSLKVNRFFRKNKSLDWIINKFSTNLGASRTAFMSDKGEIVKFGKWHERDGCFYSKPVYTYSTYSGYEGYYDGYGYDWKNPGAKHIQSIQSITGARKKRSMFDIVMDACRSGVILYRYQVLELSAPELLSLAEEFPETCAEYVSRTIANWGTLKA